MRYNEYVGRFFVDTAVTWPSTRLTATIGEFLTVARLIPVIGTQLTGSGFNTGFVYERGYEHKYDPINAARDWKEMRFKYAMEPLCHLSLDFKNSVRVSNDVTWSLDRRYSDEINTLLKGLEEYKVSEKATISYTIEKQKPIKLLFWELTFNNRLTVNGNFEYSLNWSYEWPVNVDGKTYSSYRQSVDDDRIVDQFKQKDRKIAAAVGADYDISAKMKGHAEAGWSQTVKYLPGLEEDNENNNREYNINVRADVTFTF